MIRKILIFSCFSLPLWAQQNIPLNDLSAFDHPSNNWTIEQMVKSKYTDTAFQISMCKGILVNTLRNGKYKRTDDLKFQLKHGDIRLKFDFLLMKILWKWCYKRHYSANNFWIKEKYFHSLNNEELLFTEKKKIKFSLKKKIKIFTFLKHSFSKKGLVQTMFEQDKLILKLNFIESNLKKNKVNNFQKKNLSVKSIFLILPSYSKMKNY